MGRKRIPKRRLHRPSGNAVVTLNGKDIYLGKYDNPESEDRYNELVGRWLANGRSLPEQTGATVAGQSGELTVTELCAKYYAWCKTRYAKSDGRVEGSLDRSKQMIKRLRRFCGSSRVANFGPVMLTEFRDTLIREGLCRGYINNIVNRVRHMFRRAVAMEIVPVEMLIALKTVECLELGHPGVRESDEVDEVDDETVNQTIPFLPPIVADMVRIQRRTGMRPGEICIMRPRDIERGGDVWFYTPSKHKTQHKGKKRVIAIGPKAQAILLAYMDRDPEAYCFSPEESEKMRHIDLRRKRKSKVTPSQRERSRQRGMKPRKFRAHYTRQTYYSAVRRAVTAANLARQEEAEKNGTEPEPLPGWGPNQLRHTLLQQVRDFGSLEEAQAVGGHSSPKVTEEFYAKRNCQKAAQVARKIG